MKGLVRDKMGLTPGRTLVLRLFEVTQEPVEGAVHCVLSIASLRHWSLPLFSHPPVCGFSPGSPSRKTRCSLGLTVSAQAHWEHRPTARYTMFLTSAHSQCMRAHTGTCTVSFIT